MASPYINNNCTPEEIQSARSLLPDGIINYLMSVQNYGKDKGTNLNMLKYA